MSYRYFDFECQGCKTTFEELVVGAEGVPDACPQCQAVGPFVRQLARAKPLSTIIPSYPGSKRNTAGHGAALRRPAEKAGRQISMAGTTGLSGGKKA